MKSLTANKTRAFLYGSLALNALLVSLLAGIVLMRPAAPGFGPPLFATANVPGLSGESNALIHRHFKDGMKQDRDLMLQLQQAQNKALNILIHEPLDEQAYAAQHKEVIDLHTKMSEQISSHIMETMRSLTPHDREIFADFLRKHRPPVPPKED